MYKELYNPRIEGICVNESVADVWELLCEFITTI